MMRMTCGDDYREMRFRYFNSLHGFKAVHIWQIDIQDNEIWTPIFDISESLRTIFHKRYFVTCNLKPGFH